MEPMIITFPGLHKAHAVVRYLWLFALGVGIRNWAGDRRLRADDGQPTARPSLVAQATRVSCPKFVYKFRTAEMGDRASSGFLSVLPRGSENVQVTADHHLSTIELTDLLQQHLLRIWSAHSAGVRTVIENQQTGARFLRDLRYLT